MREAHTMQRQRIDVGAASQGDLAMVLKRIHLIHPRYELFAIAALSIAQYAGIDVRRVLQSLRPKVRYGK
jgi:hypothetical protein